MKKIKLYIRTEDMVDWYMDKETNKTILEIFVSQGHVSWDDILPNLGYIPVSLVDNPEAIKPEDVEDNEIEDPGKKYKIKLL